MSPIIRFLLVVGIAGSLLSGVTFAALQSSPATLTGNSIESATADLRISTNNSSFSGSSLGFNFSGVVPGGSGVPAGGNTFYLKNFGSTSLAIKVSIPGAPTSQGGVDLNKVFISLTRVDTNFTTTLSLQSLIDGYVTGGVSTGFNINSGVTLTFNLKATMSADAINGSSANISGIDLQFTGTGI
jgi:hypothetical protein